MSETNEKTVSNEDIRLITIKKDAGVAAVLNTILPGLGWIYCEKILGGIISMVIDSILLYNALFAVKYSTYGHYTTSDDRPIFCIIYLIYWIIQINFVCNYVNPKATTGLLDFLNSLDDNDGEQTIKNITTTGVSKRASVEKIWAEQTLVNCSFCNKEFYLLGNEECICPHCGKIHKPK